MLLTIDIGNTMTDFGLNDQGAWLHFYRFFSKKESSLEETIASFSLFMKSKDIDPNRIDGAIISSVVPSLTQIYVALCKTLFHCEAKVIGPKLKTGLKIVTDNPKEVGADMVASSVGAKEKFGGACLIADLGTATKIYLLDQSGAFVGCCIGAGIGLKEESLAKNAALLPEVSLQIPAKILGTNTIDCMNSSLTYGSSFEVKALCDAIEKEVGYPCKRILTGGYSSFVSSLLPEFIYEPKLIHEGLLSIYRRNVNE
ncbi:MAG: type III pantothenate kinase [Bacilli bacterium]|nr:type III pantothenate kinase [Bacilli bacterium]